MCLMFVSSGLTFRERGHSCPHSPIRAQRTYLFETASFAHDLMNADKNVRAPGTASIGRVIH